MIDKLATAIHSRWADDATLSSLLPGARVTTGRCGTGETRRPFAVFEFPGESSGTTDLRANDDSTVETISVRLRVHTGSEPIEYAAGCSIVAAARALYERSDFDLPDDAGRVLNAIATSPAVIQSDDDGCWTFTLNFHFKVYRT